MTGDYTQAERITSNSDLNDYTQAGSYKITTDSDGATIANLPSNTTRGRLFVMQPYNADRVIQMFSLEATEEYMSAGTQPHGRTGQDCLTKHWAH